jgi:hypothetical protein
VGEAIPSIVGTSVGDNVGVVRTGVSVGKPPTPKGVSVAEGRDGFCQIYTNRLPRTQRANAPQPKPPKSKRSNVGRYFLKDSIKSKNE